MSQGQDNYERSLKWPSLSPLNRTSTMKICELSEITVNRFIKTKTLVWIVLVNLEMLSDNSFRIILNEVQKYPICTNWVKEIEVGFQICFWFKCYFCRDYRRIKWRNDLTNGWHANAFSEPWHAAKMNTFLLREWFSAFWAR